MFTLPLGIISVLLITFYVTITESREIFLNLHSFVIVILGTIAVAMLTNSSKDIKLIFSSVVDLFNREISSAMLRQEVHSIVQKKQTSLSKRLPLVAYAYELWERGLSTDQFVELMHHKFDELCGIGELPVHSIKNLSKYPPALGMTGTVIGMIVLFSNLTIDNRGDIGASLAVAMTATFYGLFVANFGLLPLADRIYSKYLANVNRNTILLDIIIKTEKKESVTLIENMNIELRYYQQAG